MKKLYFAVMHIFSKKPDCHIYQWAYMKCLKSYMVIDPNVGFWKFAEDYLAAV